MYKILLVEDDAGIAKEIADYAAGWGLEVYIAKNFENIMAEFAKVKPHLVLLDISLPYFDGYYWCSRIRNVSKLPIIFLSSASDNMNILMAMNMGADDFIAKPFDRNVLIAKLSLSHSLSIRLSRLTTLPLFSISVRSILYSFLLKSIFSP